jgi:mono/diheme cytochrome c family protein
MRENEVKYMKMHMKISILALAMIGAGAAVAQDADEGGALFERHCATCHGIDAKGQGPMAGVLMIQPVDLTRLAAGNDGTFPLLRVIRRIDGRDPLVSHGSPMPVYGDFFEGDDTAMKTTSGQPVMTSRAIADLVTYLQGLQDSDT